MKKPGTSGTLPVKGSSCGIRPDLDEMGENTEFDFSKAKEFLQENTQAIPEPEFQNATRPAHSKAPKA
ncbi:MAG: hypothetical protein RL217_1919 [Pseudomonadota bacterium]|jgi:hypothetical protein